MAELEVLEVRDASQLDEVRQLCRDSVAWEIETFPEVRDAIIAHFQPDTLDERLAMLPGHYAPPHGDILLARIAGTPCGTAMYTVAEPSVAEMSRLFVRPGSRGLGVGRRLVDAIIARAVRNECTKMRFVTARHLSSAIKLYHGMGFRDVKPWRDFAPETAEQILFMEKAI